MGHILRRHEIQYFSVKCENVQQPDKEAFKYLMDEGYFSARHFKSDAFLMLQTVIVKE